MNAMPGTIYDIVISAGCVPVWADYMLSWVAVGGESFCIRFSRSSARQQTAYSCPKAFLIILVCLCGYCTGIRTTRLARMPAGEAAGSNAKLA